MQDSRSLRGSSGFTLIELTVVLAVIVTLALILTPSITNFITDSRIARTRKDTQTIAAAIIQFYKDNGFFPQWNTALNSGPGTAANKVDLLISPGNIPTITNANTFTTGTSDTLAHLLLNNTPGYATKSATSQFGWNGPYLSGDIGADAWNNRYMVNVGLIDTTAGITGAGGAPKNAVWVISAGPNGSIDTVYAQPVTTAAIASDDLGTRIQ